ncbi:MAG: carbohydrate ABC transporter permease, partial [Clostridia bacterium]|nr:carbohydrate ABC transporter permease [Clostridia bacterium]
FKFKNLIFLGVILTMIIPHETIQFALFMKFRSFDIWGIFGGLFGLKVPNLLNTYWPFFILSITGLAFKNGLFIYFMRQYFNGVPDELEEAAYVDGAGVIKTFIRIIIPMAVPMMVTVFMFSFSWQWSDRFYTTLFMPTAKTLLLPNIVKIPVSLDTDYAAQTFYEIAIRNTCGLLILIPLVIIYLFAQRTLIEGVERSGITG